MTVSTIDVIDANNVKQTVNTLPANVSTTDNQSLILNQLAVIETLLAAPLATALQPVTTAAFGIVPAKSGSLETGHLLKASPGNLYGLNVTTTTVAGLVLVHDSSSVPSAGAVTPVKSYQIPAASTLIAGFDPPLRCSAGISVTFSIASTPFTQTDSATAFFSGDVM